MGETKMNYNYLEEACQLIISAPALSIDRNATAQTYCTASEDSNTVFQYHDTNSSRASITAISEKLASQNIGIIGLGGSGSIPAGTAGRLPLAPAKRQRYAPAERPHRKNGSLRPQYISG